MKINKTAFCIDSIYVEIAKLREYEKLKNQEMSNKLQKLSYKQLLLNSFKKGSQGKCGKI